MTTTTMFTAMATHAHPGSPHLTEDDSVNSDGSTLVNVRLGREWRDWGLCADVLNVFDSDDHDIDYFYPSRLPGEAADGVEDIHFNIVPPRSIRLTLRRRL